MQNIIDHNGRYKMQIGIFCFTWAYFKWALGLILNMPMWSSMSMPESRLFTYSGIAQYII